MTDYLARLRRDHHNLNRLYDILEEQVARYRMDSEYTPDLMLILDIIAYLNDYPKTYHHPLEEEAIALMVERGLGDASANELIHHQHQDLEEATERLSVLFKTVASDEAVSIDNIRSALEEYLALSRKHLEAEDEHLFPVMEEALGDREWQVIASRISERNDPLFADDPDEAFAKLKSRL